jgi:hypothetical protein
VPGAWILLKVGADMPLFGADVVPFLLTVVPNTFVEAVKLKTLLT